MHDDEQEGGDGNLAVEQVHNITAKRFFQLADAGGDHELQCHQRHADKPECDGELAPEAALREISPNIHGQDQRAEREQQVEQDPEAANQLAG